MQTVDRESLYRALTAANVTYDPLVDNIDESAFKAFIHRPRVRNFAVTEKLPVPGHFQLVPAAVYDDFFVRVNVGKRSKQKWKFVHFEQYHSAHIGQLLGLFNAGRFTPEQLAIGISCPATNVRQLEGVHPGTPARWFTYVPCFQGQTQVNLSWLRFDDKFSANILLVK